MEDHQNQGLPGAPEVGVLDGHEYVDLGLSVLWATCNVGASTPDDFGLFFAWGETEPKDTFTEENYKGRGKTWLEPADDPAHVHWGGRWRMPTQPELRELIDKCDWQVYWRSHERPYCRVTSKLNGNSIILPRAGYRDGKGLHEGNETGHIWLNLGLDAHAHRAPCLRVDYCHMWEYDVIECDYHFRYVGIPVRPVAKALNPGRSMKDIILLETMPELIRTALDKQGKTADDLLGYRMAFQRKAGSETVLEDEIRLVDGSESTRHAQGVFEHAFIQLCLPMVRYKYRTVELSCCETKVYVDGVDRTRYWTSVRVEVPGGEKDAYTCLEWLREWVDAHRKPDRILEADIVADDLRKEGNLRTIPTPDVRPGDE